MKSIVYILLLACLSSCGLFKVHKESRLLETENTSNVKRDSSVVTVDRSVITIREKVDTTVLSPGKVIKQETALNMDSLINGMTSIKNDLVDVRLILNPVTGILTTIAKIHPQGIRVVIDRDITKHNDITQTSAKSEAILNTSKLRDQDKTVDKDSKNGIWFLVIIIALAGLAVWVFRKFY